MALENIGAMEGWRRLWPMIQAEKGGYAGYIGMKIVLAIGAAIILGIVGFILALVIFIPAAGVAIAAVFAGKTAGLQWTAYTRRPEWPSPPCLPEKPQACSGLRTPSR
jgi:hypothetical protein